MTELCSCLAELVLVAAMSKWQKRTISLEDSWNLGDTVGIPTVRAHSEIVFEVENSDFFAGKYSKIATVGFLHGRFYSSHRGQELLISKKIFERDQSSVA